MNHIELEVAFRALTVRKEQEPARQRMRKVNFERWPRTVLIIDTETTTDAAQSLTFGSARICRWTPEGLLELRREYLIHADDLGQQDRDGFAVVTAYIRNHRCERIKLISRSDFLKIVFWPACQAHVLIVGFNLPFDLSRLAVGWSEARGKRFRRGLSLILWELTDKQTGQYRENRYRPRFRVKQIDSKRSLMGLSRPGKNDPLPAQFLDAKTLAFALTNEAHSLKSACKAFAVEHGKTEAKGHGKTTPEYIDYNRRDVQATAELLEKLRAEFDRHPIELFPAKALSPASVAKWYLKNLGVHPPGDKFTDLPLETLAVAMLSYYGGRAECRIRSVPVPVVYCDFSSMYPTVNTLMGMWNLLSADEIEVEDVTHEVRKLLSSLTLADCLNPDFWKRLRFFGQVLADEDILPLRARYDSAVRAFNIGVNYVSCKIPLWYSGPDLIAAKLLSGKAPKIIRAIRLVAKGRQKGLRISKLRGAVEINAATDDFFKAVVEQRKNLKNRPDLSEREKKRLDKFLKVEANAGGYGIFAELNPEELPAKQIARLIVHGLNGPFPATSRKPEEPGQFCFPPIAALITAAARLMLALLECCVMDAGGTYAFCDTDSMAMVASEHGGSVTCPNAPGERITALSWQQVRGIAARFAALNPYQHSIVPGSILKIEDVNFDDAGSQRQIFAYVISAKRYALFTVEPGGAINIPKDSENKPHCSEHGLGHLLNPTNPEDESRDWIRQLWEFIVLKELGWNPQPPSWLNRPAISRITASTPEMVRRLNQARGRLPYAQQVKPMNFALAAHVVSSCLPQDIDPEHFQLVAPYESDPRKWTGLAWVDRHSGKKFGITTKRSTQPDVVRVKSYADLLAEYERHPEPKSAGPANVNPRRARGLLARRRIRIVPEKICYIGKESNRLEDVESELEHSLDDVLEVYKQPASRGLAPETLEALKKIPSRELARATGISARSVRAIRNGHKRTTPKRLVKLLRVVADYTRFQASPKG